MGRNRKYRLNECCPNERCGAIWGLEEAEWDQCDACGYPNHDDEDDDQEEWEEEE